MTCPACANPRTSLVTADCRGCQIRELAQGPLFFAWVRYGVFTPEYRAALLEIGPDEAAIHAEVRAAAKALNTGGIRA